MSMMNQEPKWNPNLPKAPFIGNVMQTYGRYGKIEWRSIPNFVAQMEVVDYERGMRAAVYILRDRATDTRYPLQFASMFDLVTKSAVDGGVTYPLEWKVVKRGANYSIAPVL